MSWAAALRASNPSQPNTVTEIKYNSLNGTTLDHGSITGTKETPGHHLCDEFWHGTGGRDTGLTWDPREGSHRALRAGQGRARYAEPAYEPSPQVKPCRDEALRCF
jgi:hypothetical protein